MPHRKRDPVWLLTQLFRLPLRDRTRARALPLLLERIAPGGPRNDATPRTAAVPRMYDDADDFGDGYGLDVSGWVPRLYAGDEDVVDDDATSDVKAL